MKIEDIDVGMRAKSDVVGAIEAFTKSQMYRDGIVLYRGAIKRETWFISVPPSGARTKPLDTQLWIHNTINNVSDEHNGYKVRNGIFCTEVKDVAIGYGSNLYVIIPTEKTVFFRHEYIGDLTGWLEGDIIEHNFEAYCDGEGIDVENLNDSEKYNKFREFMSDDFAPAYIDGLEELDMNDHWNSSENEVVAFGDFYIVPVEYATKMIKDIDPEGGYI